MNEGFFDRDLPVRHHGATRRLRLKILSCAFLAAFCGMTLRFVYLNLFGEIRPPVARTVAPLRRRPDIVDREGRILAADRLSYNACVPAPNKRRKPLADKDLDKVAEALALPPAEIRAALGKAAATGAQVCVAKDVSPEVRAKIQADLNFEPVYRRSYTGGSSFYHILGFEEQEIQDKGGSPRRISGGIEGYIDSAGLKSSERIVLSVDSFVQEALRKNLEDAMRDMRAKEAAGIVMNVRTGEVLALVSLPDYEPGRLPPTFSHANLIATGLYELGSVMKIFNHAHAIESGVGTNLKYDAGNPVFIGGYKISDDEPMGVLSFEEAFVQSSNRAAIMIIREVSRVMGREAQRELFRRFGLLERARLEIPEAERRLPSFPKVWSDHTSDAASYGHAISITPLHAIVAANAVVNDGMFVPATLLKKDEDEPLRARVPIGHETSRRMRELLKGVPEMGTAKWAFRGASIKALGKTGTAIKVDGLGGYSRTKMRNFFFSAFPADAPQYSMLVMLDEPNNRGFLKAGATAAVVARRILDDIIPMIR